MKYPVVYILFLVNLLRYVENSEGPSHLQELFMKYHCYKLKYCDFKSAPKVCGFDEHATNLAVFDNECTLHKANCEGFGMFHPIDITVCDTQKAYEVEHKNDTFEFIKIHKNNFFHRY